MANSNNSGGLTLFTLLGITFIILKLTEVIAWSWWWVTAPIWGPYLLGLTALILILASTSKTDRALANLRNAY